MLGKEIISCISQKLWCENNSHDVGFCKEKESSPFIWNKAFIKTKPKRPQT